MKKRVVIAILSLFLSSYVFAEEGNLSDAAATPLPEKKAEETIKLTNNYEIVSVQNHEEDKQLPFTIDVNYPQISGENLSANAQEFNRLVKEQVQQSAQLFKNYVKADMPHMKTLPDSVKQNSFHLDYDVDVIKPAKHIIISVRLTIEGMQAGRAHPYHQHQVLNFDLTQNKELALKDVFKARANYLKVIASYANKKLNEKLQDKWMINDGTAPVEKNYQLWNLESDDILITFDEYQVAPYADGVQEVEIPYSVLSAVISAKSPIASCVKEANDCAS